MAEPTTILGDAELSILLPTIRKDGGALAPVALRQARERVEIFLVEQLGGASRPDPQREPHLGAYQHHDGRVVRERVERIAAITSRERVPAVKESFLKLAGELATSLAQEPA